MRTVNVLIIGAGPCGLGAATRLHQHGQESWLVVDQADKPGGLSCTEETPEGFLVDKGGHVVFSSFQYFDELLQAALGDYQDESAWATHVRKTHVIMKDSGKYIKVPYPFQHNIGALSCELKHECVEGIVHRDRSRPPHSFKDWVLYNFGQGIARVFMFPYNCKVWAHDLATMSKEWVSARVAHVDSFAVVQNAMNYTECGVWGPNRHFRFPQRGGTGVIYETIARLLPQDKLLLSKKVVGINPETKICTMNDGQSIKYTHLVSTMPLDLLMKQVDMKPDYTLLRHSSTHVLLFGFEGQNPNKQSSWMYFPDEEVPFYRATIFSNYGRYNVPDSAHQYSLMLEVAESQYRKAPADLRTTCLAACRATNLTTASCRLVSEYHERLEYGYPTPTIGLEEYRDKVDEELEKSQIYSRGRFGTYLYQISNQDHSVMQGVQVVDRILFGATETVLRCSEYVNSTYNTQYHYERKPSSSSLV
ncbi:FirrV-1-B5 [Feldmannia irregularis virus a]|uniref:FirrV-1-B5 n=1 Tax=Feldmannia irregularis virus a TaxID=231992 RepID=Q6XM31_9PHYC|nr:FirrV-1-B5 [Feldmannia irregularis virus a]AAR26880.1 FirrV-1-B5 [Feldmannia irregularis virus a]